MRPTRSADTIRRRAGAWTPAVHALLRHFEAVGFGGAPRALAVEGGGWELLTYIEGETENPPTSDDAVFELGKLLRQMHDVQNGFTPPEDARWQIAPGTVLGHEVICHNDPLGTNVVVREERPIALIDWELAAPGPRLADVVAAATWWVPLRRDEGAARWGIPTDRRPERLRLLVDGYGLDEAARADFPAMLLRVVRGWHETYRVWGGVEQRSPWGERWDEGRCAYIEAEIAWLEQHQAEIGRWLG